MKTEKQLCSAIVLDGRCQRYTCARYASIVDAGKPYCRQHSPANVLLRRAKLDAIESKKSEIRDAEWNVDSKKHAFIDESRKYYHNKKCQSVEKLISAMGSFFAAEEGLRKLREKHAKDLKGK